MIDTTLVPIDSIQPYENNPRDNSASISRVAESIRRFGFLQPIVVDKDGVILAGHTRWAAAQKLGLKEVPVLRASDLSPAEAKAYRLADNKVGEGSLWVNDLLAGELSALQADDPGFELADFGFETSTETRRQAAWKTVGKKCGLNQSIMIRTKCGFLYTSFFQTGNKGRTIDEIKSDFSMVQPFAESLCDYVLKTFGGNLSQGGWCLCTTPRRRHHEGFHFATAICETAAPELRIPFRADAVISRTQRRLDPDLELAADPPEKNVLLYDDIITTGTTMKETRALLLGAGHTVFPVISIRNQ